MRIGVMAGQLRWGWAKLQASWEAAEECGFDLQRADIQCCYTVVVWRASASPPSWPRRGNGLLARVLRVAPAREAHLQPV